MVCLYRASEEWIGLWKDVGDFVFIVGKMSFMEIIIEVYSCKGAGLMIFIWVFLEEYLEPIVYGEAWHLENFEW